MNNQVKQYLQSKYGENYDEDMQKKYDDQTSNIGTASLFSNLGDVIAGNKVGSGNEYFNALKKDAKDNTIGKLAEDKKSYMAETDFSNKQADFDPESSRSVAFRKTMELNYPDIVKAHGPNWANVTAGDMESVMNPTRLKEQTEARKEAARLANAGRADARDQRAHEREMKQEEKMEGLKTPYGLANTTDDAKQLKEAHEAKKNFDGKIKEMIALREKNNGGALFNREDVARGKQLSKDLLLEYKNMAKLGVLSQADENIINAIIPADPLEYNSPIAAIQGQDPILKNLKAFQSDSDRDFGTRIKTRTREGIAQSMKNPQQPDKKKTIVKTQRNQKTGETRVVFDDGTFEIQPQQAGR